MSQVLVGYIYLDYDLISLALINYQPKLEEVFQINSN